MAFLSSDSDPILYAFIGVFVGLGLFYSGLKNWLKFKKVADIATSKVRSMAAGLVELNGKVAPIELLTSPVTSSQCVYYKVKHQVYVRGKRGGNWVTTSVKQDWRNFHLQDDTGKVEVDPRQAEVDIPSDYTRRYGDKRDIEYYLAPGDTVYVLGSAKIRPGVKSANNPENFIIGKGENDPFYYITDKKEKDVQKALSSNAKWGVAGGIVITVGCLAYIVLRLVWR